jgi:hypothetical protein
MHFILRPHRLQLALLAVILSALLMTLSASASTPAVELTWSSIDGGGVSFVSNSAYTLGYTLGQYDSLALVNGSTRLNEGFWGGVLPNYPAFIPFLCKSSP